MIYDAVCRRCQLIYRGLSSGSSLICENGRAARCLGCNKTVMLHKREEPKCPARKKGKRFVSEPVEFVLSGNCQLCETRSPDLTAVVVGKKLVPVCQQCRKRVDTVRVRKTGWEFG